jgi:hypothetical protein
MTWKRICHPSKIHLPPIPAVKRMSEGGADPDPLTTTSLSQLRSLSRIPQKIRLNVLPPCYNCGISERKPPMSNFHDTTCEICGYGFDIDDVCQITYTDLSTKVFRYSCISPEHENADNVVMLANWEW